VEYFAEGEQQQAVQGQEENMWGMDWDPDWKKKAAVATTQLVVGERVIPVTDVSQGEPHLVLPTMGTATVSGSADISAYIH
jgi:hypothetical protein